MKIHILFARTALLEAGFTPDDYYFDPEVDNAEQSILLLQNGQQTQVMGDSPDKMTYTEQDWPQFTSLY